MPKFLTLSGFFSLICSCARRTRGPCRQRCAAVPRPGVLVCLARSRLRPHARRRTRPRRASASVPALRRALPRSTLCLRGRAVVESGREREGQRTTLTATTSPVAFLTLRSLRRKYQKRDLATTSLGAKMRIR